MENEKPGLAVSLLDLPDSETYAVLPVKVFATLYALAAKGAQEWSKAPKHERTIYVGETSSLVDRLLKEASTAHVDWQSVRKILSHVEPSGQDYARIVEKLGLHSPFETATTFQTGTEDDEDVEDLALLEAAEDEEEFPLELTARFDRGDHPVKVFREHRGFTRPALAEQTELTPHYLYEVESGRKTPSVNALKRLAQVLEVTIDDLVP